MLDLGLEFEPTLQGRTVYVQDEPALELALPQVFTQPMLTALQRGRLPNAEALVAKIARHQAEQPGAPLGQDYQELVTEFQPLFTWSTACWDYLLSTEGCRFILRNGEHRYGIRGDYRVVTDKDYSRIVHGIFRATVMEFAREPDAPSLAAWLRERFWPRILESYRQLEQPADPRQRVLTAYSYLRCVPYQFLNEFHQHLVHEALAHLPERERQAIDTYFLHFFTEAAAAQHLVCGIDEFESVLRQGLVKLLVNDRLSYCLLRQIERY